MKPSDTISDTTFSQNVRIKKIQILYVMSSGLSKIDFLRHDLWLLQEVLKLLGYSANDGVRYKVMFASLGLSTYKSLSNVRFQYHSMYTHAIETLQSNKTQV